MRQRPVLTRWAPLGVAVAFMAIILLRAGTSPLDLMRYAAYVVGAVLLPGTLLYRALRRRPHTLVEDLAMGAAVGLVLEIGAWALFSTLDLRGLVWAWPALIVVVFAAVPGLRRHWHVKGYETAPLGWSWAIAGVVMGFTAYLAAVFIDRNPIVPTSEATRQYLDLSYQLSLAGEAKHAFPPGLPQVAGEPLYYHWFGHGHMAMTSLVARIDLPVVAMRLAIPALCALAIVLTGVVGWRVSRRPYVGAVAAALFFAVGEFNFTHPVTMPFGTQATFVIWHGMSMIYSWVLLIAVIAPLAEIVARDARPDGSVASESPGPELGRGAWVLTALLLLGSSGAKASSIPVVAVALAATAAVLLVANRRIPWAVVGAGLVAGAAQLFATAVLYQFRTYGVELGPLQGLERYWAPADGTDAWLGIALGVWVAFGLNMLLRTAGIVALIGVPRGRLGATQWFLVAGAVAGPGLYLLLRQPSGGNEYFTRAGFAFGVIASAWGYVLLWERARLGGRARWALGAGTVAFAGALIVAQVAYARPAPAGPAYAALEPILWWAGGLAAAAAVAVVAWVVMARWRPGLRGRGSLVLLTGVLVAGAPGLVMDAYKSIQSPNGGAFVNVPMPASRAEAARWVRDHSQPTDILATNAHCLGYWGSLCDSRSFWLSAYAERSVLVEGWGFAPRQAGGLGPFWDPTKLAMNDAAITASTMDNVAALKAYGVRWIVVDRSVSTESPELAGYATNRFDNGRIAVYELR
jgi:hypothetical protein